MTSEREVPCSQTLGNLRKGVESHVGEPIIAGHSAADGDAGDTGRDDHVDGRERITSAHLIEDGSECHDGSGTRLREQDSTHDRHRIGWY
jgi:hypothetical protein